MFSIELEASQSLEKQNETSMFIDYCKEDIFLKQRQSLKNKKDTHIAIQN